MADSKNSTIDPKLVHDLIPPGFKDVEGLAGYLQEHPDIEKQLPYSISEVWDQYHTQAPPLPAPEASSQDTSSTSHAKKRHEDHAEDPHNVDVSEVSLSDALMSNEHYCNIIENTVDDWNKANPDKKITEVFITNEDGEKVINPEITGKGEVPGKIQDIEKRATDTFTMAYGTRALKAAQIAEKNKAYKKAIDDPAFKRMQKEIELGGDSERAYATFVKNNPGKARAYLSWGKLPRRSKEYAALKKALKDRENQIKHDRKDAEEKEKDKEKQKKSWDKDFYKANGRIFFGKPKVEHGGVTAFNTEVSTKLNDAIAAKQLADQKQGISYIRDVYEKQLREKVRKDQVDYLFRKEPGKAAYLMRFDPILREEYKKWQREQEAKTKQREKGRIDPNARYANVDDDPRIQKLHGDVRGATEEEYQRRLTEGRKGKGRWVRGIWYPNPNSDYQPPDKQAIEAQIRKGKLLDFANMNPDLVRDYAKTNPELASAYKAYQEQERQREQARKLGEKRGLLNSGDNESEGLTLGQSLESPSNIVEPEVESKPTPAHRPQPMQTSAATQPPSEANPEGFRDRIRRRLSRSPQPQEETSTQSEKPARRSPRQAVKDRAKTTAGKAGKAIDNRLGGIGSKARARLKNLRGKLPGPKIPTNPEDAAKKAAKEAIKGVLRSQALNIAAIAAFIAFIIALLILILAISYALFGEPEDEEMPALSPTPSPTLFPTLPPGKLTISKTGPQTPDENGNIIYTITIGGITDGTTVTDRITGKATFVSANPKPQADAIDSDTNNNLKTVTWILSPNNGQTQTITLTIKPNEDDQIIYNIAEVGNTTQGAPSPQQSTDESPNNTPATPGTPPDLSTNDFTKLMTGQGRNTGILGSEDEFVETVFNNVSGQRNLSNRVVYEGLVRILYQRAISNNINPLIPLVMWGVESSYEIDQTEFSCPRDIKNNNERGFEAQLDCALNTLNLWMNDFESKYDGQNPVPYKDPDKCLYTDLFVYAYEAYTPVCWTDDANDNARKNFVILFKEFLGE